MLSFNTKKFDHLQRYSHEINVVPLFGARERHNAFLNIIWSLSCATPCSCRVLEVGHANETSNAKCYEGAEKTVINLKLRRNVPPTTF